MTLALYTTCHIGLFSRSPGHIMLHRLDKNGDKLCWGGAMQEELNPKQLSMSIKSQSIQFLLFIASETQRRLASWDRWAVCIIMWVPSGLFLCFCAIFVKFGKCDMCFQWRHLKPLHQQLFITKQNVGNGYRICTPLKLFASVMVGDLVSRFSKQCLCMCTLTDLLYHPVW